MKKSSIQKSQTDLVNATPDIVQTTILIDCSGSMRPVWQAAVKALDQLQKELECNLISIQTFNYAWKVMKDFDLPSAAEAVEDPNGMTNMYGAILQAIEHSKDVAAMTPEFKPHHVFVVITDGDSNAHMPSELMACKEAINGIEVESTFFLLDSTEGQTAGEDLGWLSTPFKNTPKSIVDAIEKVKAAINQINNNVAKQLPPTANLMLPPAKGVH
jgi:hypothetical protein